MPWGAMNRGGGGGEREGAGESERLLGASGCSDGGIRRALGPGLPPPDDRWAQRRGLGESRTSVIPIEHCNLIVYSKHLLEVPYDLFGIDGD